jgi:cytochrome c oxidase subunit II
VHKKPLGIRQVSQVVLGLVCGATASFAQPPSEAPLPTNIFAPESTPAHEIFDVTMFVLGICALIFIIVFGLLLYSAVKFRQRPDDDGREPAQIYGSNPLELSWTVIPALIVLVFFLANARVIHSVQDARRPPGSIEVTAVGHQFWWEYRYPQYGVVVANELHVPVSNPPNSTPTFLTLLSADTDHSFWVPRLNGKTDLIPNKVNHTWIDPQNTGLYLGQCAQYCGTQHGKMLLRVYVESRQQFDQWIQAQARPAVADPSVAEGRKVFETTACINCHVVAGTVANGRFGPDLTHLMSRDTLASGVVPNTPENLRMWIQNPDSIKPGCRMPAMTLTDQELDQVTAYLLTLH